MPLLETLKNLVDKDRKVFPDRPIDPTHVDHSFSTAPSQAGRDYFRLWLVQMFLTKQVAAFQQWYPAVQSLVRFQFGTNTVEIPNLADPTKALQMEQTPKGDVIFRRKALTPLMPFNGGTVELCAGLVALKGETNYMQQFVNVVGDFAGLLAVPQLSTALDVATPVANGVQALFSAGQAGLHLGWFDTLVGTGGQTANELKAGYISIIRAPQSVAAPDQLWVANDLLYKGSGLPPQSDLLEGMDHMLLRIEIRSERDDYDQLTQIYGPFNKALDALEAEEMETAQTYYRAAVSATRTSPDLTKADRIRMVDELKTQYSVAKQAAGSKDLVAVQRPTLDAMMARAEAPDAALARGELTLEDLLRSVAQTA
jgi:hypothetical protein